MIATVILWFCSSELIQWLHLAGYESTYKLGLSILWGLYALLLIYIGIFKNKTHFRHMAFSLIGITLLKLFIYDLSRLSTISKTIIFIVLGLILLLVSYLYNKYIPKLLAQEKETTGAQK